mgnify:FL=1
MQHCDLRWAVAVALLTLVITLAWLIPVLNKFEWDALTLAWIGTEFTEGKEPGDEGYSNGYDGQFAYAIAARGFDATPVLDAPTYRYQRIFYPALAAALALGNDAAVPWTLLAINVAAHSIGAGLLAYLIAGAGGHPAFALIYGLWIGGIVAVHLDLNESLAMALGLLGALAYTRARVGWAALCFALSALTKDFGLVFMAGFALHAWFSGRRRDALALGLGATLPYAAWMVALRLTVGRAVPDEQSPTSLPIIPFSGLAGALNWVELGLMLLWLVIPSVWLGALAVRTLRRNPKALYAWVMVCGALFIVFMPRETYADFAATFRVALPTLVAMLLYTAYRYPRRLPLLAIFWAPTLIVAGYLPGFLPG